MSHTTGRGAYMKLWLAALALGLAGIVIAYFASTAFGDEPVTAIAHPGQPYCGDLSAYPACDGPNDNPNYPPSEPFPVDSAADNDKLGKPVDPPAPHPRSRRVRMTAWGHSMRR